LAAGLVSPLQATAQTAPANPAASAPPSTPAELPVAAPAAAPQPAQPAQAAPAAATEPAAPTAAPTAALQSAITLALPRDLSPWGMFMAADIVVKAVMVGLAFASVLTWTIWFAKAIELLMARLRLRRAIGALDKARSLADGIARLSTGDNGAAALLRAAETELRLSAGA